MIAAFRCDGDDRVGAGHVARCVQLALALRAGGGEAVFAGRYSGVAAGLLAAAGLETVAPGPGPLGVPAGAEAVVVDSYEIAAAEVERAAADRLVVAVVDDAPAPAAGAVLCYHLDAAEHIEAGTALLGAAYAPVAPGLTAERRPRGLRRALVTMGGSEPATAEAARAARELVALDPRIEVAVAAPGPDLVGDARVRWALAPAGLRPAIAAADVAVSAAGSTPYDLAAAGVPAVLQAIAPNQEPVRAAFLAAGLALERPAELLDEQARAAVAATGTARIDGYGAFRVRDAIGALLAGQPLPRVLAYRPATGADAERLLAWRNDPVTRAMSRSDDPVPEAEHRTWLRALLADLDRTLLVVEHEGRPVGTLRFDRHGRRAEISVTLAPESRGSGLGTQAIREATELELAARPDLEAVTAEVRLANAASRRAFGAAGYRMTGDRAVAPESAVLLRTPAAGQD